MPESTLKIDGKSYRFAAYDAIVVGSGASGFNAASHLHTLGVTDICLVTENINAGTSRNAGSDKQTYYKLSLSGGDSDSVMEMAASLFDGKCVDGDTALVEAALSARCFYRLVDHGIPFPHDQYGQYVGYKTDHDPKRRATSAGPYTSKMMTEALEDDVRSRGIPIRDKTQVIRILHAEGRVLGLLCLDLVQAGNAESRYLVLQSPNIIWATGGPAGIYADSVYPHGQNGASGLAFEAGVPGRNLTEWQYGLASLKPRWNVSGTYMQALPRFISTGENGSDEREFLNEYFPDVSRELSLIFLKGYQWPFDAAKVMSGSSLLDVLVYAETRIRGRHVFLDYRDNPGKGEIDWGSLAPEAREYLEKAEACFGRPIDRLVQMNRPAYDFYKGRGVDLAARPLEIALCAQHSNGGLEVDSWWQTRLKGFFAVGEAAGTHGVYRPGGSALNAGQVGSLRAAQYIAAHKDASKGIREGACKGAEKSDPLRFAEVSGPLVSDTVTLGDTALAAGTVAVASGPDGTGAAAANGRVGVPGVVGAAAASARSSVSALASVRKAMAKRMSEAGGALRSRARIISALSEARTDFREIAAKAPPSGSAELADFFKLRNSLIEQIVYLSAMLDYIDHGGKSRGSSLYEDPEGELPNPALDESFRFLPDEGSLDDYTQEMEYRVPGQFIAAWRKVRPIPAGDEFFENVWKDYRGGRVFGAT